MINFDEIDIKKLLYRIFLVLTFLIIGRLLFILKIENYTMNFIQGIMQLLFVLISAFVFSAMLGKILMWALNNKFDFFDVKKEKDNKK